MKKWTEKQELAINTRGKSLLVSAGAGSGKTAVLVERIIKLIIDDNVPIDKLMVVTFTKAAAEEMKIRIYKGLIERNKNNEEKRTFINKQISNLPSASISTLHSFCLEIIKRYYYIIDLDPGLKIGNEAQIGILKDKAMEELLEAEYEKGEELFINLLEMYNNRRDDKRIKTTINKINTFILNRPYPEEWVNRALSHFDLDMEGYNNSHFYKEFISLVQKKLNAAEKTLKISWEMSQRIKNNDNVVQILSDEINQVKMLKKKLYSGYENFYESLNEVIFSSLRFKCDEQYLKDKITYNRNSAKNIVKKIKEQLSFNSPKNMIEDIKGVSEEIKYLIYMVMEYNEIFRKMKIDKGMMDFNDIEHYCLQILKNDEVAEELKEYYKYIFVDEYQDSNGIQDEIVSRIMKEDNVFFVGDVKQSIYRFRMADPTLFLSKYEDFNNDGTENKEIISLNMNFRSRKSIINIINLIFERIMSKFVGDVNYDDNAKLNFAYNIPEINEQIEFAIIDIDKENLNNEELMEISKIEAEATFIAKKIKKLMKEQIYDEQLKEYRSVNYKDIVILLRTTKKWSDVYYSVLNDKGIPVFAQSQSGYFDTLEIRLLIQLLKVIDNQYQDIPILSVMRSPIFNFSIEEIASIRVEDSSISIFESIQLYIDNNDNELKKKLSNFLIKIEQWKKQSRYMSINDFIWRIVIETEYYYYISALPGGKQRQANVRILIDRAKQYNDSSVNGLFNFIKLIQGIKETKIDLSSARVVGSTENVVRIMSIHKSKGLEFPIVIIGGIGKNINLQDSKESIIMHKDLGICPDYVNTDERRYCPTIYKSIAKEKIDLETLSEEMRVLYVAMSRAKDMLFLVGSTKNLEKKMIQNWDVEIDEYYASTAKNYLDWIMPVIINNQNIVNLDEKIKVNTYKLSDMVEDIRDKNDEIKKELFSYFEKLESKKIVSNDIKRILEWEYKYIKSSQNPTKISVSELKNRSEIVKINNIKISNNLKTPKFRKSSYTATDKGTIIHRVFQLVNLEKIKDNYNNLENEIERQVQFIIENNFLTIEQIKVIQIHKVAEFFRSDLGKRMINSSKIYREKPFNLKLSIDNDEDDVLVQGVIDCYFMEKNQYILVDYKSDYYNNNVSKNRLIEQYSRQINIYRKAIESLTKRKVAQSYLYMLNTNDTIEIS
ncbi:MAG: helicase-exonuclease AddAB subunit AddA [Eubacteriaceae bacterium]